MQLRTAPKRTLASALIAALLAAAPVAAERVEPLPPELKGVGITERLNEQVPLSLPFVESNGQKVTLAQYFDGRRPTILTLNYSNCPMLCSLQLNGLVDAMQKMSWQLGTQYQIVTVSIDPLETCQRAEQAKQKYLKRYGRRQTGEGWHFLTGREADIIKLANAVGFGYTYVPEKKEFAHSAALMICTPEGRVSRYLPGVQYDPTTLRFSLLDAGQGKVGTLVDQIFLSCFHYDADAHRYGASALALMRVAGLLTLCALGVVLSIYWLREWRKGTVTAA
jgi:protein SCO1